MLWWWLVTPYLDPISWMEISGLQYSQAHTPLRFAGASDRVGSIYITNIYHWYISDIYPIFSFENIRYFFIFSIFSIFIQFLKNIFNVTHCDYVLIFSLCVLLAYDLCPQHFLSVGQLLSGFTSPQQWSMNNKSTSPNMQCTHTHTIIW